MTKEELLQELSMKVSTGEVRKEEVMTKLGIVAAAPASQTPVTRNWSGMSVNKMLYFLGAAIVLIGIAIFVAQIWEDIGSLGRILVTFGLGFALTISGSMLQKKKPEDMIGSVFHVIGGLLIPGGSVVLLGELGWDFGSDSTWLLAFDFAVISGFYFFLNYIHRSPVLTIFSILNSTAFLYFATAAIVDESVWENSDVYAYLTMAIGAAYVLLGKSFRGGWNDSLARVLYFLGSGGFFLAAFTQVFGSPTWQLLYFILAFGGLFLSVQLRSRSILFTSTCALLAHVSYITGKYFADSLSWPLALILLGFMFIGLGYLSITINRRYIAS